MKLFRFFTFILVLSISIQCFAKTSGWEGTKLSELTDVDQQSEPTDGDTVVWNDTLKLWEFSAGSGGYTNLTEFVGQTAWRSFYSDGSGDVKELAFGDSGKVLTSNGASSAPTWETPAISSQWSGTAGSIIYYNSANVGIGTSEPSEKLQVFDGYIKGNLQANVGIGNTAPAQALDVTGSIAVSGNVDGKDVSSLPDGSGTANYTAKWTDSDTLQAGIIYDNGTNVGIGDSNPSEAKLSVDGNLNLSATSSSTGQFKINSLNALNTYGTRNMFLGESGNFTLSGTDNIANGYTALDSLTSGKYNYCFGSYSCTDTTTGEGNSVVGYLGLQKNVDGSYNSVFGYQAMRLGTGGTYNVAVGALPLIYNTTGDYNVAIGSEALYKNTTGDYNVAIGQGALHENLTGHANVAVGKEALANSNSDWNHAFGYLALNSNTSGLENNAFGLRSQLSCTTGSRNMSFGAESLRTNIDGSDNIAIGADALYTSSTGEGNLAIGTQAIKEGTGDNNIALGLNSQQYGDTGNRNISIGTQTLLDTDGDNNTAIGYQSGFTTTGSGNTMLGAYAGKYEVGSNSFYVDNQDRTNTAGDKAGALLYGTFDATPANQTLKINANVGIGTTDMSKAVISAPSIRIGTATTANYVLTADANGVGTWQEATGSGIGGSGTTNYISKFSAGTTLANSQIFDNSTNIGIGTTAPKATFDIYKTAGSNTSLSLGDGDVTHGVTTLAPTTTWLLFNEHTTEKGGAQLTGFSDATDNPAIEIKGVNVSDPDNGIPAIILDGYSANGTGTQALAAGKTVVEIQNNGSALVSVLGNGNVGIGITTPTKKLDINGGFKSTNIFDNGTNVGIGTTDVTKASVSLASIRVGTGTTAGYVLTADANGVGSWAAGGSGTGIGGTGTVNYIPKFSGTGTIADSPITTDGTNVGIGMAATNPTAMLYVVKDAYIGAPTGNAEGLQISAKNTAITGDYNTLIGYEAGKGISSGADNTCLGWSAGYNNTTGGDNTFLGFGAGYGVSGLNAKASNTAIGAYAMYYSTTAGSNVVVGSQAGERMTTGTYNIAIGNNSHQFNQTGTENVVIGYSAGYGSSGQSNNYNTLLGSYAAYKLTSGQYNLTAGKNSGYNLTTGSTNVILGNNAGYSLTDGSDNVFIGDNAGYNETGSNLLYIDNSNTSSPLIWGDFSGNKLQFWGNVGIGTTNTSSAQLVVNDNVYITNDCSALTFTDRTPYPETKEIAYSMIKSFEKAPTGNVVDKDKMSPLLLKNIPFPVEDKDTKQITMANQKGRDLSMTVSALIEVVKDMDARIKKLEGK